MRIPTRRSEQRAAATHDRPTVNQKREMQVVGTPVPSEQNLVELDKEPVVVRSESVEARERGENPSESAEANQGGQTWKEVEVIMEDQSQDEPQLRDGENTPVESGENDPFHLLQSDAEPQFPQSETHEELRTDPQPISRTPPATHHSPETARSKTHLLHSWLPNIPALSHCEYCRYLPGAFLTTT